MVKSFESDESGISGISMRTSANLQQPEQRIVHTKKAGFTLIELLVVVGITAMVMITVSTIFMTFLLSNARTNARRVIQSDGNTALSQIEFEIRNAKAIGSCPGGSLTLTNNAGKVITFNTNAEGKIILTPEGATDQVLTANTVASTLSFNCVNSPQIKVSFRLNITDNFDNSLTQEFQTTVQVRNLAL